MYDLQFTQGTDLEEQLMNFLRVEAIAPIELRTEVAFDTNLAVAGLAAIFISVRPLVFVLMLVIVMSILARPFAALKAGSRCARVMLGGC